MAPWLLVAAALACLALRPLVAQRSFDATPLLGLLAPFNTASFWLRSRFARTRTTPRLVHANEAKDELYRWAGEHRSALEERERELRKKYALQPFFAQSAAAVYRENVYLLDLLDRHVDRRRVLPRTGPIRAVDVGSQDFRYAFALARWLGGGRRPVTLTGVELEGDRLQRDLRSRRDHGTAYAAEIDDAAVRYEVGDFLAHEASELDVVFLFFPFVLEYALLRWGLPRRFFAPERVFEKVHAALRSGGAVVVMNHTEDERRAQRALLERCGFVVVKSVRARSRLVDWADDASERSITLARRP